MIPARSGGVLPRGPRAVGATGPFPFPLAPPSASLPLASARISSAT